MDTEPLVLVIEDETPIQRFLRVALGNAGFRIIEAAGGQAGLAMAASHRPDAVILDLNLPDMDGLEVLKSLREWFIAPVIILSARDQERDKVTALDLGADDYLGKPFGVQELLARVRVALRHAAQVAAGTRANEPRICIHELVIDLAARRVFLADKEIHLTPIEYKLLVTFAHHAGKVLTHRFLLKEVWGATSLDDAYSVRVFVSNVRRKIESDPARPRYLLTEQGVGYRFWDGG